MRAQGVYISFFCDSLSGRTETYRHRFWRVGTVQKKQSESGPPPSVCRCPVCVRQAGWRQATRAHDDGAARGDKHPLHRLAERKEITWARLWGRICRGKKEAVVLDADGYRKGTPGKRGRIMSFNQGVVGREWERYLTAGPHLWGATISQAKRLTKEGSCLSPPCKPRYLSGPSKSVPSSLGLRALVCVARSDLVSPPSGCTTPSL